MLVGAAVAVAAVGKHDTSPSGPHGSTAPTVRPSTSATTTTTARAGGDPVAALPKFPPSAVRTYRLGDEFEVSQAVPIGGDLWLAGYRANDPGKSTSLYRLDPASGKVTGDRSGRKLAGLGVAYGDGALWELSDQPNGTPYIVYAVDLQSGQVRLTVPVPGSHVYGNTNPIGRIAFGLGSVWVYEGDEFIARLDPQTGRQIARVTLPENLGANGLAANSHGLWAVAWGDTPIMRVDPITNTATVVTRFPAGFAQSIAADERYVWTTHFTSVLDLVRIDASDPTITANAHIPTADVATGDGRVWFLGWVPGEKAASPRNHYGLVGQIDPDTLKVIRVAELPIGQADETRLAVAGRDAWVVDSTTHTAWKIAGR